MRKRLSFILVSLSWSIFHNLFWAFWLLIAFISLQILISWILFYLVQYLTSSAAVYWLYVMIRSRDSERIYLDLIVLMMMMMMMMWNNWTHMLFMVATLFWVCTRSLSLNFHNDSIINHLPHNSFAKSQIIHCWLWYLYSTLHWVDVYS